MRHCYKSFWSSFSGMTAQAMVQLNAYKSFVMPKDIDQQSGIKYVHE